MCRLEHGLIDQALCKRLGFLIGIGNRWFLLSCKKQTPYLTAQSPSRAARSRYCDRNLVITTFFKVSATVASTADFGVLDVRIDWTRSRRGARFRRLGLS